MMSRLWSPLKNVVITCLLLSLRINFCTAVLKSDYFINNVTSNNQDSQTSTNDDVEQLLYEDVYMINADRSCRAGNFYSCLETGAGSVMVHLMNKARFTGQSTRSRIADEPDNNYEENIIHLVKTSSIYDGRNKPTDKIRPTPSSESNNSNDGRDLKQLSGFLGFLFRSADRFLRTTGLVIDLNDEITEGGVFQPKFIDEIYTEIDTLEDKNAKPVKQYQFKKLIIPLLIILKIFKLKLLVFLPVLLGLASFKKIIALLLIIVPGIIGYLKVCKPDLGYSYGSYGHSSFYNVPPSLKRKKFEEFIQHQNPTSFNNQDYAHYLAYHSSRNS